MKILKYALACACLFAANSFAAPLAVPQEKAAYVGTWQGKDMSLTIAADGKIAYKRVKADKQVNLSIELDRFNGNNFDAGVGIFNTTFVVSKPPTTVGTVTTMVVDGVELTKVQ